ncbi:transcription factor bHLH110-like isoform X2 [Cucumis melo]|uniref:Transcription factor bHLH110-like isoform X2 n=1 Tax=Cucumis melo TaxID=3656 RepID=A0A1S3CRI3_CUCME|nr:transcription factor bHLH110-like isoform X2 [Cucumis melo]
MESTANLNHHQHQLQDHQLLLASSSSSSSLSVVPSYFGLGTAWSSNISLNSNNTCNVYSNPTIFNGEVTTTNSSHPIRSTDCEQKNTNSTSSIMLQDLGNYDQWNNNNGDNVVNTGNNNFFTQSLHHNQQQISSSTPPTTPPPPPPPHQPFPKFTEILNNNNNITNIQDFININSNNDSDLNDLTHKLLIKTLISSGCQINGADHPIISRSSNNNRPAPHFPQIYPSINVSNWNISSPSPPPPSFSNSLDLNLQTPTDMLVGNFSQNNFGIFKEALSDFGDQIRESPPTGSLPCIIPSKMTTFSSTEVCKPKRGCNSMESRLNQQSPLKKSRLDSRASCPPFKVRKEKLGDRIAALQQLVAPFGKTDTASVLMEAIGYIKFLQNQTLSVPYMKPAGSNKAPQPTHRSSVEDGNEGGQNRDLRSRGLCLVPLGCLSYVTGDGGGGVGIWPPPGFNGGTS